MRNRTVLTWASTHRGKKDDSSLTEAGWERANRLADLATKTICPAGANDDGEGLRPRETVMPLVARLGLT